MYISRNPTNSWDSSYLTLLFSPAFSSEIIHNILYVSLRLTKRHTALFPALSPHTCAKLIHLMTLWVNSIQKIYVLLRVASVTTLCKNCRKKKKLNKEPLKPLCRYKNVPRDQRRANKLMPIPCTSINIQLDVWR